MKIDTNKCIATFDLKPSDSISHKDVATATDAVFDAFSKSNCDVVKITGRGPIWLYSAVVHAVAHLAKAVMVYDAVNKVWVVVASHNPSYRIGQVIEEG